MKKSIKILIVLMLLLTIIFVLTGCSKKEESNDVVEKTTETSNQDSITLTLDSEANKKEYKIKFESNTEDNQMSFNKEYPTTAQIRNENGNYVIYIQIDELSQAEYDITVDYEKNYDNYKVEKIGDFEGYSYTDKNTETTTVKALIDGSNPDARIYATMIIGLEDESNSHGLTSQELYKSSKVQFIVNSITCTVTNTNNKTSKTTDSLSQMTDKDYYEKAAEFVKTERLNEETDMSDKKDYQKFVEYEGFGVNEEKGVTYAYMHIGDASYYIENGKVEQGPAASMAYKIKFVNGEPVSYENPTDGAGQEADYKKLFPDNVASKMITYNFDFSKLEKAAEEYYKN